MKKYWSLLVVMMICIVLVACGHEHSWQASNCTSPKICASCGETEGEALGHSWNEATCEESKFCSVCGLTSGEPLGHIWEDATCTEPMRCVVCAKTEGTENGHDFTAATCTEAQICVVCEVVEGKPLGHTVDVWETIEEASCTVVGAEIGVCTVCDETCEQEIPLKEHTPGEWEVLVEPSPDKEGTRVLLCADCEVEMEKENFTLSDEELEKLYKESCERISYDSLARTPGEYEGKRVKFSGYVVQVCSEAQSIFYYSTYRVATSGRYNNVVYIKVDNYGSGTRILEDDYVTFYGEFDGLLTYETVMGSSITIPSVVVEYID